MLSVVRYQVLELRQVNNVFEPRFSISLEFSICLSGTKEAQGTRTKGSRASWLCHSSLFSVVL